VAWISLRAYRIVGRGLAAARKRAGVSQDRLASLLQKPQSFISAYERGQRRIDVLELVRIAAALKLDPCELFASLIKAGHTEQP
jgi:transcriptional regulator with XRE-family HTH domain